MRLHRFHAENLDRRTTGETVLLDPDQASHLSRVLRLKPGDRCILFDGAGHEFRAEVVESRKRVVLTLEETTEPTPMPVSVVCAVAPPKGKKSRELVESLTHVGVDRIIFMQTERSVVDVHARSERKQDKYERVAIEALKLCGRSYAPTLDEPADFDEVLERLKGVGVRLIPTPDAVLALPHALDPERARAGVALLIGPEGGFSGDELAKAAEAGFQAVRIAPATLPTELAAAIAVSAVVLQCMG